MLATRDAVTQRGMQGVARFVSSIGHVIIPVPA